MKIFLTLLLLLLVPAVSAADEATMDSSRDILVTFHSDRAHANAAAPYRFRKRYTMSPAARRNSVEIAKDYDLSAIDDWPIKSLSIYCVVFRIGDDRQRDAVVAELRSDDRVESAQILNRFETGTSYDDTYAGLQLGLAQLDVSAAHAYSTGKGVRVAVIDSDADRDHEDLQGRITAVRVYVDKRTRADQQHGTAVVSVIGAIANNSKGIVGVAPEATIELHVACWREPDIDKAICDSFSLAKALDALVSDPADVLNMSLTGPNDPLLRRLIEKVHERGTIVVAAHPSMSHIAQDFPANMDQVIGVRSSGEESASHGLVTVASRDIQAVFAPGRHIMVAIPEGGYDFRSGSSIAAAHVSGVIALLLSDEPNLDDAAVQSLLRRSQTGASSEMVSVDACKALRLMDGSRICTASTNAATVSELKTGT
jgi:subtilisin family serine protease